MVLIMAIANSPTAAQRVGFHFGPLVATVGDAGHTPQPRAFFGLPGPGVAASRPCGAEAPGGRVPSPAPAGGPATAAGPGTARLQRGVVQPLRQRPGEARCAWA